MQNKQFFMVTCAGMSGSKWVASSLNKHPEISCSHSAGRHKIYNRNYTDEEIKDILEVERSQFDAKVLLSDIFSTIEGDKNIQGNVHAFRLYRLKEAIKNDKKSPLFRLANLVRNPINVTLSRAAMFTQMCVNDKSVRERVEDTFKKNINLFSPIVEQYKLDTKDYYVLSFFDAVLGMQKLSDELRDNPDVYHVKIEDLKSPTHFIKLVDFLASGKIQTTMELATQITSSPAINSHTKSAVKSLKEKYNSLENWKKEALKIGFEKTDILEQYKKLNYNFDFLDYDESI